MFARPTLLRRLPAGMLRLRTPIRRASGLQGLGELGDELSGAAALPDLVAKIKSGVIDHAGNTLAASYASNGSLPAVLYGASDIYAKTGSGQTLADAQAAWQAWRKVAEPQSSDSNIYWVLARCINRWADKLIAAYNDQAASGVFNDAQASKASFTLMDTTQQGTTWMGGTVTTSKLDNAQWGAVFETAFNAIAKGVSAGVLPFTYLDVLLKAMCTDTVKRRFPVWNPPFSNLTQNDPRAAAFRTMMKQLGWNSVTQLWFGYTQQAWAQQNEVADQQDAVFNAAVVALNYASGKAVYDQIAAKIQDYFSARSEAVAAIKQFDQLQQGPLGSYVSSTDIAAVTALKSQFAAADNNVYGMINPVGLWPANTQAGLSFLGVAQYVVGGVIAIGILGMVVWAISIMTSVSRSAAAQTKATADSIIATVDDVKASCLRAFELSQKTPEDEAKLQACLLKTEALYKAIPEPPSGSDPLGLKWIAMLGVVGLGGFMAWKHFGKKG